MTKKLISFFVYNSIPDQYKTQKICDTVVFNYPSLIGYCLDKYKKMCDEAVDNSLAALKLICNWFFTSKMIKKPFIALFKDENLLYFNEGSGDAVFNCSRIDILDIDLNNINLDNDFDEDDPDSVIPIRLLA